MLGDIRRVPIAEFAQRYHVSIATIRMKRGALGLPALRPAYDAIQWTPAMLQALPQLNDSAAARQFGIGRTTVARKGISLKGKPLIEARSHRTHCM